MAKNDFQIYLLLSLNCHNLDILLSSKSLKRCVSVSSTFLGQIREMTSLFRCPWFSALKLSLLSSFKLPSSMTRCDPHTNTNTKQIQVTIFHDPVRFKATILTLSSHCIYNTRLICSFLCQNLTMHTRPTGPTYWVPCASFWLSLGWVLKAR